MIDKDVAYNNLPLLPPVTDLNDIEILKKVNTANKAISQLNGLIRSLENPEIILEPLKVKEAVESSSVENIHTTISQALQAELFADTKLNSEQKETKNYKKALLFGFQTLRDRKKLTINSCIQIQQKLGIPQPGIRNLPGTKLGNKNTGSVYYTPPAGAKILRKLLTNFVVYYNDNNDDPDFLMKMAILHYQFEAIHPFFDGNGRTGRILMVLYLVTHDCLVSPTLFISRYINQHKQEYYRLLREVTFNHNWKEWVLFILDAAQTQANATSRTILEMLALKNRFKTRVLPQFNFTYEHDLLTYLFSNAYYTQSQLILHTHIKSNKTALEYLNTLAKYKVIKVAKTASKEKVYFCQDLLKLLK